MVAHLAHAAARAARASPATGSTPSRVPGLRARRRRPGPRVDVAPLGPAGVGPPVALPGRRRRACSALLAAPVFSHAPGHDRQRHQPRVAHHPPGLRPAGRRLRARLQRPAAARRSSSTAPPSTTSPRCERPSPPTPGVQAVAPIAGQRRRHAPRCCASSPTSSPQDEATTDLVHRLRDDVIPAARRRPRTGAEVLRRRADRHVHRHVRQDRRAGCRGSSAPSSRCRSCC